MKKLIYTDESRLNLQTGYNTGWASDANAAISKLEELCGKLNDEQITLFLSNPIAFIGERLADAKKEYDAYMNNLPKSVRLSTAFSDGGLTDAVKAIHKALMAKKPHRMVDKTAVKNGVCLLTDEGKEALKAECSVYGGEKAAKVWQLSCKAAKALNELQTEINGNNAFADAVECWGRWQGFITINDESERYKPNPNILNTLPSEKE